MVGPSLSGSSTSAGRCRVTRTKSLLLSAFLPSTAGRFTSSSNRKRLSIIVLPTSCTPSPVIPSPARFSTASGEVQSSTSETRSVRTRFTSSGISQSRERRPDSMWATATRSLVAASAAARVELTSPATSTRSAGCSSRSASMPVSAAAVCSAWVPEPTPRLASGSRIWRRSMKPPGERLVVVLARMQEPDRDPVGFIQRGDHRRRLDEVRPRPHDREHRGSHSGAT